MTPIEEILKISQNLEQILQNQYGAVGRGLREKADSVQDQLPEETLRKIGKLASMRNKATHENLALATEKIAAFRRIAGEVCVSLMLYQPFDSSSKPTQPEVKTSTPEETVLPQSLPQPQEPVKIPLWKENEEFSWDAFYQKQIPDIEKCWGQRKLYHKLLENYAPTSPKVQETVEQMRSVIERLYEIYNETLQKRQMDLQSLINEGCRSDSPLKISAEEDIDKLKRKMISLQPENSENVLMCAEALTIPAGTRRVESVWDTEFAFRWCPPGEFMMGSENGKPNEQPVHKVQITEGFWLLETQVTNKMWGISYIRDKMHAYAGRYTDCHKFCQDFSRALGQTVKLPTEAQWEYACRAGVTGDYTGILDEVAWYKYNSNNCIHDVGEKKPNTWGLYDMLGNVPEWCSDYYDGNYYARSPEKDPENTIASNEYVIRGGGWNDEAEECTFTSRNCADQRGYIPTAIGLRILLVPNSED